VSGNLFLFTRFARALFFSLSLQVLDMDETLSRQHSIRTFHTTNPSCYHTSCTLPAITCYCLVHCAFLDMQDDVHTCRQILNHMDTTYKANRKRKWECRNFGKHLGYTHSLICVHVVHPLTIACPGRQKNQLCHKSGSRI